MFFIARHIIMLNVNKFLIQTGLKKEKILFCYFESRRINYAPLDVGYILAILKKEGFFKRYAFDLVPLGVSRGCASNSEKINDSVAQAVKVILARKSHYVFFFSDSMISSTFTGAKQAVEIAKKIKNKKPETFIGLQGSKLDFLRMKKFFATRKIDCMIHGNSENAFLCLDKIIRKEKVSGVVRSFSEIELEENRRDNIGPKRVEKEYLDNIPSPYLSGVLDGFLLQKKEQTAGKFSCYMQSSRGCIFGCYYCARSAKFENVRCFSAERFYNEIEYLVSKFGFHQFFILDDVFAIFKKRLLDFEREFEIRKTKNEKLKNIRLSVMARAEGLDEETIAILRNINVVRIQFGIQTINPELQYYMNRNINIEKFRDVAGELRKANIEFLVDIIGGLPYDTIEWFKKTVDFTISLKPNDIQISQLFLNPGTLFYKEKEKFGIKMETTSKKFRECYAVSIKGDDDAYNAEAYAYAKKKVKKHPEIGWDIFLKAKTFESQKCQ